MKIDKLIHETTIAALSNLYDYKADESSIQVQNTKKDQKGDITIVVFPFVRISKKSPEETGREIGNYLLQQVDLVDSFEVVKGFLNLNIKLP